MVVKKKKSTKNTKTSKIIKNVEKISNQKLEKEFYHKYRWFFTKSGKLVYGGKSAEQNEEVVRDLIKSKKNRIIMHTKIPGSPFAVIDDYVGSVTLKDMDEAAIWTACFSRAWRNGLKKTTIDIFLSEQLVKKSGMSAGTFGVIGKIDRVTVELKLALCKQKDILRAAPLESCNGKKLAVIFPGNIEKEEFAKQISDKLKIDKEEVLNALQTGGFGVGK